MNQERWTEVDRYIAALLAPPDAALDAAIEAQRPGRAAGNQVAPSQGQVAPAPGPAP